MSSGSSTFTLAYYFGNKKTGRLAFITRQNDRFDVDTIDLGAESGSAISLKPIMLGATTERRVVLLDPKTKEISVSELFPADTFAAHVYSDPYSNCDWYMNDGDKETGNDTLNCGDKGSSVTVVADSSRSDAKWLGTICVGRGHHQAAFTAPSSHAPQVPRRAFISNLKDGSLSVIGTDPKDSKTYLKNIQTIVLAEPDKEENGASGIPNNAFPHGLQYSAVSGKVYNLNNGYGNVLVIDPVTGNVEHRFNFKGHSNLFVTRDGRYIIGRGADRKSDPAHVIAKLSVIDVRDNSIKDSIDLKDIYISKYFLNPEGTKLYLTTSSSGSPEQAANCKADTLLIFDLTSLPKIKLTGELALGSPSGTLEFVGDSNKTKWIFSSNSEKGELIVIDGQTDQILERITVCEPCGHSRVWRIGAKL